MIDPFKNDVEERILIAINKVMMKVRGEKIEMKEFFMLKNLILNKI
jgi:hypothetical protein